MNIRTREPRVVNRGKKCTRVWAQYIACVRLLVLVFDVSCFSRAIYCSLILTVVLLSDVLAQQWAHFNTADDVILTQIDRIYNMEPYDSAIIVADQLKAHSGSVLVPCNNQFVPLKYALATARNRSLTAEELAIYRSRYEWTAQELYRQAIACPDFQSRTAALWRVYKLYPATHSAQTALDNLSEYFYRTGDYEQSLRFLDLLSTLPSYESKELPPSQLAARRLLCQFGCCSLLSGDAYMTEKNALKERLAEFERSYPNAVGVMGGRKVDLYEFLTAAWNRLAPNDSNLVSTDSKSQPGYKVDASGLWRLSSLEQKPQLLVEDSAPDSVKALYQGSYDNASITGDGLIFACLGVPESYMNPNRRSPLELKNRLVCVDSRQFDAIAWEKEPSSPSSRWLTPMCYNSGRLYIVEVQTTQNAYELTLVCLDAASGMELFRTWLLSTSEKPTVHFLFYAPFTFYLTVEKDPANAVKFEIDRITGEIESVK